MTERLADTVSGFFLMALAIVFGAAAQSLPTTITDQFAGPGFMPTIICVGLALCGFTIAYQARAVPADVRMPGWSAADRPGMIRIAVVIAATGAYNILLAPLGYIITTFLFLIVLLRYLDVSLKLSFAIALFTSLATYAVFVFWLRIILPMGLLEFYI